MKGELPKLHKSVDNTNNSYRPSAWRDTLAPCQLLFAAMPSTFQEKVSNRCGVAGKLTGQCVFRICVGLEPKQVVILCDID